MIRYDRAPSREFRELLTPGALLSPLLTLPLVAALPPDPQFREGDRLHVYYGRARLLDVSRERDGSVKIAADEKYSCQQCATGVFRRWAVDEQELASSVGRYLERVEVHPTFVTWEGEVQALWSTVRSPWIPFDREAQIGYATTEAQTAARKFAKVEEACERVAEVSEGDWATRKVDKTPAKLDQLAVDPEGRLILIELKHGGAGGLYYTPLQLLQYVHEWAESYARLKPSLDAIIEARKSVGLSPASTPSLSDRLRPVIAFGESSPSVEVRARFDKVLAIANANLPAMAGPIEAWKLESGTPVPLDTLASRESFAPQPST